MSASFYDLMKYAKTGIAAPSMTFYDMMKARAMFGGGGFPMSTISGVPPISFKSDGTPLTAWSISGNMTQTGTPTPSAPIQPEETGDKTANLFNQNDYALVPVSASAYRYGTVIGVLPQGDYTFSATKASGAQSLYLTKELNGTYTFETISNVPFNFTADGETKYIIRTANNIGTTWADFGYTEMLVNSGTSAIPYEPYGYALPISCGGTTSTIYLTEPLRKIGDNADSVSSDGTVTRKVYKYLLTGNEEWTINGSGNTTYFALTLPYLAIRTQNEICTHFEYKTVTASTTDIAFSIIASGAEIRIRPYNVATTTLNDFKQFLSDQYASGTPVTVWYVLNSPNVAQITAPTIAPARGSNTLTVGTTLQPSGVSITGHIKAS